MSLMTLADDDASEIDVGQIIVVITNGSAQTTYATADTLTVKAVPVPA